METKSAWNRELELGVATVDSEHQLQGRLVAVLREAVETGRGRTVIEELLLRIEDTAKVHFLSEELLMRLDAYEQYGSHVEEHRLLLEQLAALRARFGAEPGMDLLKAVAWLEGWLADHVKGMDRRFTESMKNPPRP